MRLCSVARIKRVMGEDMPAPTMITSESPCAAFKVSLDASSLVARLCNRQGVSWEPRKGDCRGADCFKRGCIIWKLRVTATMMEPVKHNLTE